MSSTFRTLILLYCSTSQTFMGTGSCYCFYILFVVQLMPSAFFFCKCEVYFARLNFHKYKFRFCTKSKSLQALQQKNVPSRPISGLSSIFRAWGSKHLDTMKRNMDQLDIHSSCYLVISASRQQQAACSSLFAKKQYLPQVSEHATYT